MLKPTTLAMILAGGRVDELNVLTYCRPKSALPFGGFGRVIDFALSNLMNSGIERVAILSQYRSYSLINHIGTGSAWDMLGRNRGISILPPYIGSDRTGWYRGSADAVYRNIDFVRYYDPEHILILSGDHIYKMDYQFLIAYHREKKADLTMGVIRVRPDQSHRFGIVVLDDEDGELGGRVTSYWEKPKEPESDWASLTVLCFKPEVMYRLLNENQNDFSFEFGRDIVPRLMKEGGRVYAYKFCGYWGYTQTIEEYWQSNMDLLGQEPLIDMEMWGFRTNLDHRGIRDFQPVVVGDDATVHDSLVHNGSVIEGMVRRSIIFPGVIVEKRAVIEDSVLFFNNHIGRNCRLSKVIADVNNTFGEGVVVGSEDGKRAEAVTVVGWNNVVPDQVVIGQGATIYPLLGGGKWKKVVTAWEVLR